MMGWKSVGYQGLDRNACPLQWKGIREHVEKRIPDVEMVKLRDSNIDPKIRNAVTLYAPEGVQWYRELIATPVGGEYPPVAPWS
jgi:hypothetical protein